MATPDLLAQFPVTPNAFSMVQPEFLAGLPVGQPAGPIFGAPFLKNGMADSTDPKKSAAYEKRQVAIRLLQTGWLYFILAQNICPQSTV